MVVMQPCDECGTTIPKGVTIKDSHDEQFTAVTNYCPICGSGTNWSDGK